MNENKQNEIVKVLLDIKKISEEENKNFDIGKYSKISISDVSIAGIIASSIREKGLFRVTMKSAGELMKAKKGGFYGSVLKDGKIVEQARLIPSNINYTMIFVAIVLKCIDKKLDTIQRTQKEILNFLEQDKISQLKADSDILLKSLKDFYYNYDKEIFKNSEIIMINDIYRNSSKDISFYKWKIKDFFANKKKMSLNEKIFEINRIFGAYRLALYNYSFSLFLKILFIENVNLEYFNEHIKNIEFESREYKNIYGEHYDDVKNIIDKDNYIGKKISEIFNGFSKKINSSIDFFNISDDKKVQYMVDNFINVNRYSGIEVFSDRLRKIAKMYNEPIELVYKENNLYIENKYFD